MAGTYLLRLPGSRESPSELLGASHTAGTPTLHLHTDFQFATPAKPAGFSLGMLRRIPVATGEIVLVPPSTLHAEQGPGWHILQLPQTTVYRFAGSSGMADRSLSEPFTPVVDDPQLASSLAALVTAAVEQRIGSAEFLHLAEQWVRSLGQRCDLAPLQASGAVRAPRPSTGWTDVPMEWK